MKKERIYALDWIRGIALLGMIFHHALFAVEQISYLFNEPVEFAFLQGWGFWTLQELFVAVFLLISGICTAFSRNVLRRGLIVSGGAAAITLVTAVLLPAIGVTGLEIWFGILHMFGFSMLIYALLSHPKKWVPVLTASVLFVVYLAAVTLWGSGYALWVNTVMGFPFEGFYSADYYPLFPYVLLFFAGTKLGPAIKERRLPAKFYALRCKPLEWVGRHSLWVYLLHQPLIFGIVGLIYYLK